MMVTVIPVVMAMVKQVPITSTGVSASTVVQAVAPPRTSGTPDTVTVTGVSGT